MNGKPALRKALPPRPSQDLGYGGGGAQNGYRNGDGNSYVPSDPRLNGRMEGQQEPNGKVVLEGYRSDIMSGFQEKSRYNPVSVPHLEE
jgi:hypothetical protein